ncbi:MAG: helix-turn-helix domain-containing protein [Pseudonocardiaceae bacterium]
MHVARRQAWHVASLCCVAFPARSVERSSPVAYVPSIKRRRLGAALRRLREQSNQSTDDVARALGWSKSKVSRIETAAVTVTPEDVRALLRLYDALTAEVEQLVTLAREDKQPGWWRQYSEVLPPEFEGFLGLESEAARILSYEPDAIPGLLQTGDYAKRVLGQHPLTVMPYEVERSTQLRRARQSRLTGDDPVELDAVVNEGALRRLVGGSEVMRGQLVHLITMSELPNITVRVLPFTAGEHPGMNGPFTVLEFPDPDDPRIVYLDVLTTSYYLNDLREVGAYLLAHERLRALALGRDESRSILSALVAEESES